MTEQKEINHRQEEEDSSYTTKLGFLLSFLWLVIFLVLYLNTKGSLNDLTPNELGDMLAGAVAPLALIWIVLGYYNQTKELRYQRLEMTGMKNQMTRQTETQLANLEFQRSGKRPVLVYLERGMSSVLNRFTFSVDFENIGRTAINCKVHSTNNLVDATIFPTASKIEKGKRYFIQLHIESMEILPVSIELIYEDLDGTFYKHLGEIENNDERNRKFIDGQMKIEKQPRKNPQGPKIHRL